ncbi:MAG: pyruvate dehydrogenase (acetyl-transferring), homodimeric type [Burkholderiales bacterium]|nr:pyruvate dehydrogenase (acetyl-transferring), homodimeric type [Burkholderiales bacterium]MCA3161375.1 pyruvate dehydrogenase (acetyl-transferring), homodimeric type [Burkholderiales bacterium]MCA3163447.1 pyruvate dehydrogenase (acetyl-transferring), homodimeric type [Burkholderiales bacterium]MCA3165187.1 pyruvate dehydrogenase (acetyl-transferring), homodimeric type [Burkholderiales bacterium]MCA3170337.1 pyruvate dehydrogenase (acetyl-transferring), homodimeric type [Burkholderiales bact
MSAVPEHFHAANDPDSQETQEWLDALEGVMASEGPERAHYLLERLVDKARRSGAHIPFTANTAYVNTIPPHLEAKFPGNLELEERLRSWMRWNAMAMVVRANRADPPDGGGLGGHIASFASVATMLGIGFNHFWKGPDHPDGSDLVYFQGHSSPGIYARAFLEGRISEDQLINFRQEVDGKGLSSYPHPKLMPEFWQFPTVSMGLGPLMGIYQARFLKYLHARGIADTSKRKVWVFCGDGEMDEPESLGAISLAAREKLDNLVFVINCNLQRLDGPVRGNGKIIQELEADFRGTGWNVLKVIWGSYWDPLLAKDTEGILQRIMMETVDGEYQNYRANDGAFVRKHFFGKHPKLLEMVSRMTDEDIWRLNRGGHDPYKVYAAYHAAVNDNGGKPTLILAKTVKGFGMGKIGEGKNTTHQQKKLDADSIRQFRDRFGIPVSDDKLDELPFVKPADDAPELKYLHERRQALGGYLPARRPKSSEQFKVPELSTFQAVLDPTAEGREISTTQAFVRILTALTRDKELGPRIVPIVPDEARTFGMEGMFRQLGIYAPEGQKYEPVDKDQVMYYREDKAGQILEEGINEAGAMSDWIAAATSYATNDRVMLPFYIYYSMFGFQRIGDLAWAAGDMQARGFLLGGTSGRTTLNGEGLQHEDGHSHLMSATIPNCMSYDPTFAHELAVIIQHGLKRIVEKQDNVFYYLSVMNENYAQPGLKPGTEDGIIKGMYKLKEGEAKLKTRVQLLGSGTILRESLAAQELLAKDWGIAADVWSVTSYTELARDGYDAERWNMLHPTEKAKVPYVTAQLESSVGPIISSTDYMRLFSDQVRPYMPKGRTFKVLGTDGFGRSDFRYKLRNHFEVDRHFIVVAALKSLADEKQIEAAKVAEAIKKYGLNPDKQNPITA